MGVRALRVVLRRGAGEVLYAPVRSIFLKARGRAFALYVLHLCYFFNSPAVRSCTSAEVQVRREAECDISRLWACSFSGLRAEAS